ncbi:hypothetical protein BU15DRAFT_83960 [Melanogaster broomeanus]|nr:hypothetical protein BU15DRAFT_83960 [Melanogaster broomeanus]
MPHHNDEDFTSAVRNVDDTSDDDDKSSRSSKTSDSEESSSESDEDLRRIRAAVVPHAANATPGELRQALEQNQKLLLEMREKQCALTKRIHLLEAHKGKGRKGKTLGNLTEKELRIAKQEEEIRTLGRKYSAVYCLWINGEIFPLRKNPQIDLFSSERWLSPLSMEDGVKTEIYSHVPKKMHKLMAYKDFGAHFGTGVTNIRSEMASDVKSCAAAIFGLNPTFFSRGYQRFTDLTCRALLVGPNDKYTKYAPILFPRPEGDLKPEDFLKTAKLVQVLRVSLFGKSSIDGAHAPGPKPKGKIWELRNTSVGMIAAAAVSSIFVLSGDPNIYAKGEKTEIPYLEWHNFYRSLLLEDTPWARSVFTFFDNALFPATSSIKDAMNLDGAPATATNDWEEAFERRFGVEKNQRAPAPVSSITVTVRPPQGPTPPSISTAMQELDLGHSHSAPPPAPAPPALAVPAVPPLPNPSADTSAVPEAGIDEQPPTVTKGGRPKPRSKRKGKVADVSEDGNTPDHPAEVDNPSSNSATTVRKSRRNATKV